MYTSDLSNAILLRRPICKKIARRTRVGFAQGTSRRSDIKVTDDLLVLLQTQTPNHYGMIGHGTRLPYGAKSKGVGGRDQFCAAAPAEITCSISGTLGLTWQAAITTMIIGARCGILR